MAGPRRPIPPSTLGALHLAVVAGRWGLGVPEAPRGAGAGARGSTQDIMSYLELRGQERAMGKPKAEFLGRHLLSLEASRQERGWDCQVDQEGGREVTSQSSTTHHRLGKQLQGQIKAIPGFHDTGEIL